MSHHITADSQNLVLSVPYHGSEQVHMGNGQGLAMSSLGFTTFFSPYNSHTTLTLNNLLHVPHITKNLVSISKFARDKKVFFEFYPSCCYVKSQGSKQVLLKGILGNDGFYCFENVQLLNSSPFSSSSKSVSGSITSNIVLCLLIIV